ncbi:MAG: hypothetical protein Kow0063_39850 [Anaerolineae bacterium]
MKEQLRGWLAGERYQDIIELAGRRRRVLSFLTALTYDPDPLISWRAVEAMGLAAARISDDDPEYVRVHLRRLMWLLNDESGGIGWRAPEMMGEIIRSRPEHFADFLPILISILDMEEEDAIRFRAGTLWAIGRLAPVMPEAARSALPRIIPCLDDPHPQTRGMAVWCLGQLKAPRHLLVRPALLEDEGPVDFFSEGQLVRIQVGRLARAALGSE